MALNIIGTFSVSDGSNDKSISPFLSYLIFVGFFPRKTRVSMGSRSGSIGGFVTCEAFSSILSQYTG